AEERPEERLLGDEPVADEGLAEGFPRVVRRRGVQRPVLEDEALAGRPPREVQGSRARAAADPLQDVRDLEGGEVAAEAHGWTMSGRAGRVGADTRAATRPAVSRNAAGPAWSRRDSSSAFCRARSAARTSRSSRATGAPDSSFASKIARISWTRPCARRSSARCS